MKYTYTLADNRVIDALTPELARRFAKNYNKDAILDVINRVNNMDQKDDIFEVNMHENGTVTLIYKDGRIIRMDLN